MEVIQNHTNTQYLTVKRQKFEKSYTVSISWQGSYKQYPTNGQLPHTDNSKYVSMLTKIIKFTSS